MSRPSEKGIPKRKVGDYFLGAVLTTAFLAVVEDLAAGALSALVASQQVLVSPLLHAVPQVAFAGASAFLAVPSANPIVVKAKRASPASRILVFILFKSLISNYFSGQR
jgi:hypothetical protein